MKTDQLSFIPNDYGVPNDGKDAEKVEKQINNWQQKRKKRVKNQADSVPYWKQVSTCAVL